MKENLTIIGAGQCGMKLANDYYYRLCKRNRHKINFIALSTSSEDSVGILKQHIIQIDTSGSGKKYTSGSHIWNSNIDVLKRKLENVRENDVVYFTSAGGGSGSSSIKYVTDILLRNKNRIFLALILPFRYENLPFKPNAIQTISTLSDDNILDKISVMLFDNDKLSKSFADVEYSKDQDKEITFTNLENINEYIVNTVDTVMNLTIDFHDDSKFSPFTIDQLEHDSVIFSKGLLAFGSGKLDGEEANIKFNYGKIKQAKNLVIAKVIGLSTSDYLIQQNVGQFLNNIKKISGRAKNARVMYGVIRTNKLDDGLYIVIANNMNIDQYITKLKEKISERIEVFKTEDERAQVLNEEESEIYDV
jgi:cell division GTPase FtsZ